MKIQCDKKELLDCVNICAKAAANKAAAPVLEGILIETLNEAIQVTGYDLLTGIQSQIPAEIKEQGKIVLSAKLFNNIISKMTDDIITISVGASMKANITGKTCKFNILGMDPADFPELPVMQEESSIFLRQGVLKSMIQETAYARSKIDVRPEFTGILFDIKNNTLNLVASDKYRIAIRKEKIENSGNYDFIVPGEALNEIAKILSYSDDSVELSIDEKHVMFKIDNILIISRTISGNFIDYDSVIPANNNYAVNVDTNEFISAIERISVIVENITTSPTRCLFTSDNIDLSIYTATGASEETVGLNNTNNEELEIGLNHKYLLDALKAAKSDEICIELTSNVSPCIIKPTTNDKFTYVILPVRLKKRPEEAGQ